MGPDQLVAVAKLRAVSRADVARGAVPRTPVLPDHPRPEPHRPAGRIAERRRRGLPLEDPMSALLALASVGRGGRISTSRSARRTCERSLLIYASDPSRHQSIERVQLGAADIAAMVTLYHSLGGPAPDRLALARIEHQREPAATRDRARRRRRLRLDRPRPVQ
jgi:hypothetical protein